MAGEASCHAIQLLYPSQDWRPRPRPRPAGPGPGPSGPGGGSSIPLPPTAGYYPGDLQSAYGLATAAAAFGPGTSAPTVAVVDAYDDPNAATDLAAYRASLSKATDPNTGLTDGAIPPLCPASTSCTTLTKLNQTGGTNYPKADPGWAEEISLDLDMVSAICPACNIVLVEASSSSYSNLAQAVAEAKTLAPAAITNSYGGGEFSTETTFNSVYSAGAGTAMTAATGDSGYGAEFPAVSSGLTAVGGTTLTYTGTGTGLTWNPQTAWSGTGSGCSSYESMPRWQTDPGVYSLAADCAGRQVGDVSAVADPSTGVAVYDTFHEPGWMVFGGTSAATQIIGAIYGLAAGAGPFQPDPGALYPDLATGATGPTPGLVSVDSGSNSGCGAYLCNAADSLSSGYNGPAGLGTPRGVGAFAATSAPAGSLAFTPASDSQTAGTWSTAMAVDLSNAAPSGGLTVAVTTSSPTGQFSGTAGGSSSSSLILTVPGGATASPPFYYRDTTAGSFAVTAAATGWATGVLPVSVTAGPLTSIAVSPASVSVPETGSQSFTASGADAYGNPISVTPSWATTAPGSLNPTTSSTATTFTAGSSSGSGTVTATQDGVSGRAAVTVTAQAAMSVTVAAGRTVKKGPNYQVPVTVTAADAASAAPLGGAAVSLQVFPGSTCTGTPAASGSGTTNSNGQVSFTFSTRQVGAWCAQASVTATGFSPGSNTTTFRT